MITVISGTNRPKSNTAIVAKFVFNTLLKLNADCDYLSLEDLPKDFAYNNFFVGSESDELKDIIENKIVVANKFIIVSPEYNGSYPGVLKSFLDSINPDKIKHSHALLIGVSSGRAGNLRGMDQLTNSLNYLKISVDPFKNAISHVNRMIENEVLVDEKTKSTLKNSVERFANGN